MDDPLWTDAHAPDLDEIPQEEARDHLRRTVEEPMNLLVFGPPGSGKSAAVRAMAREAHDDPDNDFVVVNVADFFDRTKKEIRNDPRFESFLTGRSDMAKRDMISHVLKETASYAPVSGDYKTLLLDNAEAIREDFQQALRRVMERYHRTTQFVIATRQPTKLIPPIRSRCFPVTMRAPTRDEITEVLTGIVESEDVEYDPGALPLLAAKADGNLRSAILAAQTVHSQAGAITTDSLQEPLNGVGYEDQVEEMLDAARAGEFGDARSALDDLLIDEGLDGTEILDELLAVAPHHYSGDDLAALHERAGEVDFDLERGTSDRIHLANLLASLAE